MPYYTSILEKYNISDCKTFENVKNKFPNTRSTYLRKIIYLKGFKISKDGKLSSSAREKPVHKKFFQTTLIQSKRKKRQRYPKVNLTAFRC